MTSFYLSILNFSMIFLLLLRIIFPSFSFFSSFLTLLLLLSAISLSILTLGGVFLVLSFLSISLMMLTLTLSILSLVFSLRRSHTCLFRYLFSRSYYSSRLCMPMMCLMSFLRCFYRCLSIRSASMRL